MTTIIVKRGDGLGTRILTIMHAHILASRLQADLKIIWPDIGAPFYAAESLLPSSSLDQVLADNAFFRSEGQRSGEIVDAAHIAHLRLLPISCLDADRPGSLEDLRSLLGAYDGILYDMPHQILADAQLGVCSADEIKRLWTAVNWNDAFVARVRTAFPAGVLGRSLAIHMRRGDIMTMLVHSSMSYLIAPGMEQLLQRFTAKQSFANAIGRSLQAGQPLIVCGESNSELGLADPAISVLATSSLSADETVRAFLDLYILSLSAEVIAPFHSYFSRCAAAVGTCVFSPLQIEVSEAVAELFAILDVSERSDKQQVKALICAVYGRMLSAGTPLTVSYEISSSSATI